MQGWEILATVLALAYLLLAIRQHPACWPAAIGSCVIYVFLMFQAALYAQVALQIFYAAMAIYGWMNWTGATQGGRVPMVRRWRAVSHVAPLLLIAALGIISGSLLERHSDAAFPYLDALTGWGAVVATWMVARKILENWYYWLVIDAASVYLFVQQGLWWTAGLFCVYLLLAVVGLRAWLNSWQSR